MTVRLRRYFSCLTGELLAMALGGCASRQSGSFSAGRPLFEPDGNPLAHVHMSQWMYLQPDWRTMINRDVLIKGGVVVAHITEQFVKP